MHNMWTFACVLLLHKSETLDYDTTNKLECEMCLEGDYVMDKQLSNDWHLAESSYRNGAVKVYQTTILRICVQRFCMFMYFSVTGRWVNTCSHLKWMLGKCLVSYSREKQWVCEFLSIRLNKAEVAFTLSILAVVMMLLRSTLEALILSCHSNALIVTFYYGVQRLYYEMMFIVDKCWFCR